MKKTKWIAAALALVLALSLAACGKKNAASDLASVQAKGKLVVGITEFAPMDYKSTDDEWIGFDADMAKLVAEKLAEWKGVPVEQLARATLENGKRLFRISE